MPLGTCPRHENLPVGEDQFLDAGSQPTEVLCVTAILYDWHTIRWSITSGRTLSLLASIGRDLCMSHFEYEGEEEPVYRRGLGNWTAAVEN